MVKRLTHIQEIRKFDPYYCYQRINMWDFSKFLDGEIEEVYKLLIKERNKRLNAACAKKMFRNRK